MLSKVRIRLGSLRVGAFFATEDGRTGVVELVNESRVHVRFGVVEREFVTRTGKSAHILLAKTNDWAPGTEVMELTHAAYIAQTTPAERAAQKIPASAKAPRAAKSARGAKALRPSAVPARTFSAAERAAAEALAAKCAAACRSK
jgi:hypothetical protein